LSKPRLAQNPAEPRRWSPGTVVTDEQPRGTECAGAPFAGHKLAHDARAARPFGVVVAPVRTMHDRAVMQSNKMQTTQPFRSRAAL
jgi:hypothetical protein